MCLVGILFQVDTTMMFIHAMVSLLQLMNPVNPGVAAFLDNGVHFCVMMGMLGVILNAREWWVLYYPHLHPLLRQPSLLRLVARFQVGHVRALRSRDNPIPVHLHNHQHEIAE